MNKPNQPQTANRWLRQLGREAGVQLAALRDLADAPAALAPFVDALEQVFVANEPQSLLFADGEPRPLIGVYCILAPEELIYAAGAVPVRLCGGCSTSCSAGEEYVPRDGCPLAKSSLGLSARPGLAVYDCCDVVIVPTTCDAKRKFGEELSRFREVWMLEVPHLKESEISQHAWLQQIHALKERLERHVSRVRGKRTTINARALDRAIDRQAAAHRQMRRLMGFRALETPPIWGRQATAAANAFSFMEVGAWTGAMIDLNDELEQRQGKAVCPARAPRVMIAGSPVIFPNLKLPQLIEELGAIVVADESCVGERALYDLVGHPERNLPAQLSALAARCLMPCVCPSFTPNQDRLVTLRRTIATHRIDGVVYHVLKGCVVYDFEVGRVESALKELEIPVVRIETDYSPEDVEQLRTRIEAFVEMLIQRKPK